MSESKRTRTDYRTDTEWRFRSYLLHEQPKGIHYSTRIRVDRAQLHDTHRDQGRFTQLGEDGKVKLDDNFVDALDGIPAHRFEEALREIEGLEGLRIPGSYLVKALRYFQQEWVMKRRGITATRFAMDLDTNPVQLGRWRDECVRLCEAIVFNEKKVA